MDSGGGWGSGMDRLYLRLLLLNKFLLDWSCIVRTGWSSAMALHLEIALSSVIF